MKLVTAIIKPVQFNSVYAALDEMGVAGVTATEVRGIEHHKGQDGEHKGRAHKHKSHDDNHTELDCSLCVRARVKLEVAVSDEQLDEVVDAIARNAHTRSPSDGCVLVTPLDQAIRLQAWATYAEAG